MMMHPSGPSAIGGRRGAGAAGGGELSRALFYGTTTATIKPKDTMAFKMGTNLYQFLPLNSTCKMSLSPSPDKMATTCHHPCHHFLAPSSLDHQSPPPASPPRCPRVSRQLRTREMAPAVNLLAALALVASPRNMPPLRDDAGAGDAGPASQKRHIMSTSEYGVRRNHPTAFDDDPSFKGPLRLEQRASPDLHRIRIRNYYLEDEALAGSLDVDDLPSLSPSTPTGKILKTIVDHLARRDAPVDAKEVAESMEFYLRSGKRLIGAARRVLQNSVDRSGKSTITIHDLCSGHGLTGLIYLACNPPGRLRETTVRTVLVDQFEPRSHSVLRETIAEVCPWVSEEGAVLFETMPLEDYASQAAEQINSDVKRDNASIIISTHACGSLTDKVLQYAMDTEAASLAVMPCCYTGTDSSVPYGVRRMLGVSASADIQRSFNLADHDYHVDFAAIPRAITPMNRIIVAERRR